MSMHTKFFRSLLAFILVLAAIAPYGPVAMAARETSDVEYVSGEDAQEVIDNADYVIDLSKDVELPALDEAYTEQVAALEEQANLQLYGTTRSEDKPETKVANYTDYVFLSFRIGDPSRNFNWQQVTTSTKNAYFANSLLGEHAGYYKGTNTGLFMPITQTTAGKNLLNKYKLKTDDIAQVKFYMSENATDGIVAGGTKEVNSFFTFWSSGYPDTYKYGCSYQKIKLTTSSQIITFAVNSGDAKTYHIGKQLYGVRWDIYQTDTATDADGWASTDGVRVYTDYIYVGPPKYKPVLVQYTDSNGTVLKTKVRDDLTSSHSTYNPSASGYIGYGECAFHWPNDGLTTSTSTEQTIWGWEVYKKNTSGSWYNTYEFVVDPTTFVCTEDVQFRQRQVTIPILNLNSEQVYENGDSTDDRYMMSVDAFDTMQIENGSYGKPVDFAIVMDRSGSMGDLVSGTKYFNNDEATGLEEIEEYLKTLDKTKWEGYYRARGWSKYRSATGEHVNSESSHYIYTMPLRYNRTRSQKSDATDIDKWEVLVLETDCNCDGDNRHAKYGIYPWLSSGMNYCDHVKWVSVARAYKVYNAYREATNSKYGRGFTARFGIGVSRMGKQQEAVEKLLEKIYASNAYLPKDQYNKVSIVGYGHTVFIKGYPYYKQSGLTQGTTPNKYPPPSGFKLFPTLSKVDSRSEALVCSAISVDLHYANYDQVMSAVRSHYIFGQTRIDAAIRLLSNNQSYIENHYYKNSDDTGAHALEHTDYMPAKNSGRNRAVIAICDGLPTWYEGEDFHAKAANSAVAGARNLKKNKVTIYSVGISEAYTGATSYNASYHAASTSDKGRNNNFMLLLSSNYAEATGFPANATEAKDTSMIGSRTSGTYFYANASSADTLATSLEKIYKAETPELKPSGKSGEASLWLYEEFRREWMLDTKPGQEIKIYAKPYLGNGTYGEKVLIGKHPIVTETEDGKKTVHIDCAKSNVLQGSGYTLYLDPTEDQGFTANLKWTDAKKSFLRKTSWDTGYAAMDVEKGTRLSANYGYKVIMEIPLEVDRNNTLGGNNIDLTKAGSGCYKANSAADTAKGDLLYAYDQPNANVDFAVGSASYDYFMTMEDYVKVHSAVVDAKAAESKAGNPVIDAYNNMIRVNADMRLTNDFGYSNLDYVSFEVKLLSEDGTLVLHRKADRGEVTYDVDMDCRTEQRNLLKKDTTFNGFVKLSYSSHDTDSFGREPYADISEDLTPNLYVPKFAVVDFDAEASVDLQKEGELVKTGSMGANGAFTATGTKYNFRADYDNATSEQQILRGWDTIPYTVIPKNPTMDGATEISREIYIIPGNVISYDDTLFTYGKVASEAAWVTVGSYTPGIQNAKNEEAHGYDENFATSGDFHGASMKTTVSSTAPVANLASFEFFGTGFELLSRSAPDSGAMIVEVYKAKDDGTYNAVADTGYLVDTYLSKETLHQVPVVQYLSGSTAPAKYKVNIIAFYDIAFDHSLNKRSAMTEEEARKLLGYDEDFDFHYITFDRGGMSKRDADAAKEYSLYIDGCRVFNSVAEDKETGIRDFVYSLANEKAANIFNINTQIVDVNSKVDWSKGGAVTGALYIAATGGNAEDDGVIDTENNGFCLGMDGTLRTEKDGEKYYVLDSNKTRILHEEYQTAIYYKHRPSGRVSFYCTKGNEEVLLTDAEVRLYVGNGESVVYYSGAYHAIGPENEVYLAKDQGVAFTVSTGNDKIFLGLKTRGSASMQIWDGSAFVNFAPVNEYTSDATMYFDISAYGPDIIIKNVGTGILSLVNVKCASASGSVAPITVSGKLLAKAAQAFETDLDQPVVDEELKIYHSLNLQSDISVNLVVPASALAGYDRYVMECTVAGKTTILKPEVRGDLVYFTVEDLSAVDMTENIHSVLYLTKGEETFTSLADDYSIAYYAYTTMNKDNADQELKTLCADLLRYGSMAQLYKNYNVDALADEEMTDLHKSYLTELDTVTFGNTNTVLEDLETATVSWVGKTMILDSKVTLMYIADLSAYTGDLADLSLRATYTDIDGETVEVEISDFEAYNAEKGWYAFKLDTLLAAELRTAISAAVYEGDARISETLLYSAASYGNGKTGALLDLCKALLAYSDSAKAFFE